MSRSFALLVPLLAAGTLLAAPAPRPFRDGWNKPINPDYDCKFLRKNSTLTIEVPGSDHDFSPKRRRFNAPRLLRDIEGDFVMQVRVRAVFRPSEKSAVEGEEPSVAAGLVLIPAAENCIRLEYGAYRRLGEQSTWPAFRMSGERIWNMFQQWHHPWHKEVRGAKSEQIYLRLERRGRRITPSLSPDGKKWTSSFNVTMSDLPAKLKVGLAAYSTSTEPFKPCFDQFKLFRVRKKDR